MKRKIILAGLVASALSFSGCKNMFSMERGKTLSPFQVCEELKRTIIFQSNDPNHDTQWSSPSRQAILLQDYKKYNCSEVLNEGENKVDMGLDKAK